jgi:hypothetical protein
MVQLTVWDFCIYVFYLKMVKPAETRSNDFASLTVHFVNICVKNQQMHQLFIKFINYIW